MEVPQGLVQTGVRQEGQVEHGQEEVEREGAELQYITILVH